MVVRCPGARWEQSDSIYMSLFIFHKHRGVRKNTWCLTHTQTRRTRGLHLHPDSHWEKSSFSSQNVWIDASDSAALSNMALCYWMIRVWHFCVGMNHSPHELGKKKKKTAVSICWRQMFSLCLSPLLFHRSLFCLWSWLSVLRTELSRQTFKKLLKRSGFSIRNLRRINALTTLCQAWLMTRHRRINGYFHTLKGFFFFLTRKNMTKLTWEYINTRTHTDAHTCILCDGYHDDGRGQMVIATCHCGGVTHSAFSPSTTAERRPGLGFPLLTLQLRNIFFELNRRKQREPKWSPCSPLRCLATTWAWMIHCSFWHYII